MGNKIKSTTRKEKRNISENVTDFCAGGLCKRMTDSLGALRLLGLPRGTHGPRAVPERPCFCEMRQVSHFQHLGRYMGLGF